MSKIEWCDLTINPAIGCSKCSPGCDNCYAEKMAFRWSQHPNPKIANKYKGVVDERGKWTGKINVDLSCFDNLPKSPKRIFVGSMTDIFHEKAIWKNIDRIFEAISKYPQHTFLILTKRPDIAKNYFPTSPGQWLTRHNSRTGKVEQNIDCPLPNVWLGVTVCNQQEEDEKIPVLLGIPAAKRFLSIEPMLGPISLNLFRSSTTFPRHVTIDGRSVGAKNLISWVITGGETGSKARPMHPEWARSIRDQCKAAGVPFFFTSWGEWLPESMWCDDGIDDTKLVRRVGKKLAGRLLDGAEYNEFPEEQ